MRLLLLLTLLAFPLTARAQPATCDAACVTRMQNQITDLQKQLADVQSLNVTLEHRVRAAETERDDHKAWRLQAEQKLGEMTKDRDAKAALLKGPLK